MLTKSDRAVYNIAKFFYRRIAGLSRRLNRAALDLNFLMYKMEFGERDDDIYIISYPRSGTTVLQMILYQLTTEGNMDFEHFDHISPWIRNEAFENRKPPELKSPRIIKSHDTYSSFDHHSKGRFIYVFRNVIDVAISKYHHEKNYKNPQLRFDDFIRNFFKPGKYNWFSYHREWLVNKKNIPILYIQYEDVIKNFDTTVDRITEFCRIDKNSVDFARVKERSGFEFMKQYETKFGIQPEKNKKIYNEFIRRGKIGEGVRDLSNEQMKAFEENFDKYIRPLYKK